jgi:hypothetical protein
LRYPRGKPVERDVSTPLRITRYADVDGIRDDPLTGSFEHGFIFRLACAAKK